MSDAPPRPVLLTSLASAALLDGRGDLELNREMRGARVDWGGVFGQCVRLTGPWRMSLSDGGGGATLPATQLSAERAPGAWTSRHRWNGYDILQSVAAVPGIPGVVRTLACSRTTAAVGLLTVTSAFTPYLLPVLVEGIWPHSFRVETGSEELRVRQRGFGLSVRSNVAPSRLSLNRASWLGGRFRGRVDELGIDYELSVPPGDTAELRCLIVGGLDRDLTGIDAAARQVLADPTAAAVAVDAADRTWVQSTPTLRFPDAPVLERGYVLARSALRRLFASPGDNLTGLLAGYPWYSAIWGRDLAWMLWAVLWLGDFDWVDRSIETALRFQSRSAIPILAGEPGELAMQISPGPIFFYGTSDTTLYYPLLIETLGRHAGVPALSESRRDAIREMIAWGERRSDPVTGLLRNGGEAEEISLATASLARIRAGINSPDTTIWDSADRRDHAIDVQVLWWRALRVGADLCEAAPDGSSARWRATADHLADTIRSRYVWEAEGYLYDTLREGRPVEQLRPNGLRAVSAGIFPVETGRRFVERVARDDLTTDWGVRVLSSQDPSYDPIAYHLGEVWTIATAWAADAALAVGNAELGVQYLATIAGLYESEGGWANECYRGDRAEAFDSCFLLGFSVGPFLTTVFERLWGLGLDATAGRLGVHPTFPSGWRSASIENLRLGRGTVGLDWSPERLRVAWSGPGALAVDAGATIVTVAAASVESIPLSPRG
jgi:glycogen debranching enzyme